MSIVTELKYTANLDKGVCMTPITPSFMGGDQEAHRITIDCYRQNSREAVDLSGAGVTAYFVRADGMTIPLTGETNGSKASVLLPAACYAVMGRFSLVIKLSMDDGTADSISTVFWGEGAVSRSRTDVVIDPDSVIPSLEELLAQIAAMEIATSNANTAAGNANQAADDATSTANAAAASAQATANAAATQAVEIATVKGDEAVQVATDKGNEAVQIATEQVEAQNQAIAKIAADLLTTAPAIECEASGSLVTVTDAAAQPAVQLVTHIEPVQEGEGDPRPANKNLWSYGDVALNGSETTITFDKPLPAGDYTLSLVITAEVVGGIIWVEVDKDGDAFAANASGVRNSLTISSDGTKDSIYFRSANDIMLEQIQLERGTEATDYVVHDPGNMRPIRGWDKVEVQRAGKNLAKIGEMSNVGWAVYYSLGYLPSGTYTFTAEYTLLSKTDNFSSKDKYGVYRPGNDLSIGMWGNAEVGEKRTFTFTFLHNPELGENLYLYGCGIDAFGATGTAKVENISIVPGKVAAAYEPYQGQTLTADLPETVYGGTLDWGTGVLTDDLPKTLTGNELWSFYPNPNNGSMHQWYFRALDLVNKDIVCSHYKTIAIDDRWGDGNNNTCYMAVGAVCIRADDFATVAEWKQHLRDMYAAGTPVQVWYKTTNPTVTQLTPQQLETLKGTNNVWSDCGDTSLVYVADSKMYIDNKFAELEAAILSQGANV